MHLSKDGEEQSITNRQGINSVNLPSTWYMPSYAYQEYIYRKPQDFLFEKDIDGKFETLMKQLWKEEGFLYTSKEGFRKHHQISKMQMISQSWSY